MQHDPEKCSLKLGDPAPYFSLPATDGKIYSLSDFANARGLVVVFTSNHCPYAQSYESRLADIARHCKEQGVAFVAICSNDSIAFPEDSFEQMQEKSRVQGFPFPYLRDETQSVARAYDASCTPEAYVFDAEKRLRYHGAVDDNHQEPAQVRHHYLQDAIALVLSGQSNTSGMTDVIGCSIKWKN